LLGVSAASKEDVVGGVFEGRDGGFDGGGCIRWVPLFVPNVEFRIVAVVVVVSHFVSNSEVAAEAIKIDGILGLTFEGQTVAESEAKGFEQCRWDTGLVAAEVVDLEVRWLSVESVDGTGLEIVGVVFAVRARGVGAEAKT
jgi:hypothetical protein